MKGFIKTICILFLLAFSAFSISGYYFRHKPKFKERGPLLTKLIISPEELATLKAKALSIKKYAAANRYNTKVCFLLDMKIASGKNRFFVYDLLKDSVAISGLVAHGSCDNNFQTEASFSNEINSGCSCAGKFRVGNRYIGKFGLAYKLYGLDQSNSNACKRTIVLHAYGCVPEVETYPLPICNSRGCPMVSPGFLQILQPYIDHADKPILLCIFDK